MADDVNVVIRQGRFRTFLLILGGFVLLMVVSGMGIVDIPGVPDWFGGGDYKQSFLTAWGVE